MKHPKSNRLSTSNVLTRMACSILSLMLCLSSWSSNAEPAHYNKMALHNVSEIYTQGFFKIAIKQGEDQGLDLYIRDSQINTVKIGIEEIKGSDGVPNSRTLFVKQVDKATEENRDGTPIADITITVKNLSSLKVHDTYQVLVDNMTSQAIKLQATGRSDVYLSNVHIKQGTFEINHESILTVINSQIEQLVLNQYSIAKVGIDGLLTNTVNLDLRDRSYFSAKNFTAASFHSFGTFKSRLFLKEPVEIASTFISGSRSHKVDATTASLKVVNCNVTDDVQVHLPNTEILTVKADGNSQVYYQGNPTFNVDQSSDAIVQQSSSTALSHADE